MSGEILILDACALIALQRGETGGEVLVGLLIKPDCQAHLHALNLCEVFYDGLRHDPSLTLDELLADLARLGITLHPELPLAMIERAARLKAHWRRISLADCVGLALAEALGGWLVTTDHHELDRLAQAGHPIRFLR